jgi:hypothetical protein
MAESTITILLPWCQPLTPVRHIGCDPLPTEVPHFYSIAIIQKSPIPAII